MTRYILLLTLILNAVSSIAQHTAKSFTIKKPNTDQDVNVGYLEHLPDDYNSTAQNYPLIIFLHGQGESGNGINQLTRVEANGTPQQIKLNQFPKSFTVNGKTYKFIVISPQLNTSAYGVSNWNPGSNNKYLEEVFRYVRKNYRVDPSRVYLTGLSLGGEGVWNYAGLESNIADSLAAIGVVCGSGGNNSSKSGIIARSNLPVWAFHGDIDNTVNVNITRTWTNQINAITPNLAKTTIYPGVGHNAWDYAYHLSNNLNATIEENIYVWFLKHQRANLAIEPTPTLATANDNVPEYTGQYRYGSNIGYYTDAFTDYNLVELITKVGGSTIRPSLPNDFLEKWGYTIKVPEFRNYQENLGVYESAAFVGTPAESLRDKTIYGNPDSVGESKVFKNLYEPIWNANGTVNENNYYADYIYRTVQLYGPYVKFWEVWNEPDLTTSYAKQEEWLIRAPEPKELENFKAPVFFYIRMLRITYEIVKKYYPNSYVTTGGLGYTQFLDAILRFSDNPNKGIITNNYPLTGGAYFDVLSYHYYPNYDLKVWNNTNKNFDYSYHSDAQANRVIKEKLAFENVLTKYKYDGIVFPKKIFILTETGVSKKSFDINNEHYRYGSIETQRNFIVKMNIQSQKNDIKQTYFYTLGDFGELNNSNTNEFSLMGFYENLNIANPSTIIKTEAGIAHTTTSSVLYNYIYDENKTRSLNLPANVDGAAFTKENETRYVLWAKTLNTEDEDENASYTFPLSINVNKLFRYEWDFSTSVTSSRTVNLTASPSFFTSDTVLSIDPNNPGSNPNEDEQPKGSYILFPNPSKNKVTIRMTDSKAAAGKYYLYNTAGKKLREEIFENKQGGNFDLLIDTGNLPIGVFIINIEINNIPKPVVLKMIKNDSDI